MPVNDASQRQQAAADRRLRDQIRAVAERANGGVCEKQKEKKRASERARAFVFLSSEHRFSCPSQSIAHLSLHLLFPSFPRTFLSLTVERDDLVDLSSNKLEQELTTLNALLGQSESFRVISPPFLSPPIQTLCLS